MTPEPALRWGPVGDALRRFVASRLFYPLAALVVGALTYLYALPWLGYVWDDWEVVFLLHARNAQLFSGYFAFDRPFAWPYQVMYSIFGLEPLAWHAVTYLVRWLGVLLLYYSMRAVWPKQDRYLRWVGLLILVYPGYLQQSISAAYNRHFTAFLVFAVSMYLMVLGTRKGRYAWLFMAASWATAFIHLFTIEYFAGLEFARPVILWLLISGRQLPDRSGAIRRTTFMALPYLLIFALYSWWRVWVFPTTIPVANYAGDFKLMQDFDVSVIAGVLAVITRAFLDLIHATLQVWLSFLTEPESWTLQGKISWLAFSLAAMLALVYWRVAAVHGEVKASSGEMPPSLAWFGLWAFLVGGLPIWLTSKQLSTQGRWDDRFALALMIPACILVVFAVAGLVRSRWQQPVLAVLLALSIATQVIVANRYRLEWAEQSQYYWQLHWRVPSLDPGTAIISFEQPSASVPGYDASFAMNMLFNAKFDGGSLPYWFFTNDRFLNFELRPDKVISYKDRNLQFKGNTSAAITLIHQGEDRCLQVLDAAYADQPFYGTDQEQLVALSNTSRISDDSSSKLPVEIFGPEPKKTWCYYFQKADLARQLGDWAAILELERESKRLGYAARFGPELLPFIEAHARTGDWQGALELSRAAQATVSEMDPLLCSTWSRLTKSVASDAESAQSARTAFQCKTP